MSNKRRIIITFLSVLTGTGLSYLIYRLKRGGQTLSDQDIFTLWTNFGFSILLILCLGFFFLWNNKKNG